MPAPDYGYKFLQRELDRRRQQPTEVDITESFLDDERLYDPSSGPLRQVVWEDTNAEVEPLVPDYPPPAIPDYFAPETQRSLFAPFEFVETRRGMLPQVREAIENYNRREGIRRPIDSYPIAAQNQRRLERGRLSSPQEINARGAEAPDINVSRIGGLIDIPAINQSLDFSGTRQPIIRGLDDELAKVNRSITDSNTRIGIANVENVINKYPELETFLRNPSKNEGVVAKRIDPKSFEKYKQYTDLEQKYSDPAQRADLYQKVLDVTANKLDLGDNEYQEVADTLKSVEDLYTSGNPVNQETARGYLRSFGLDVDAIEKPAFQPDKPIIGGGGYVRAANSDDLKYIRQRADDLSDALQGLPEDSRRKVLEEFPGLKTADTYSDTERTFFGTDAYIRDASFDADDPGTRVKVNRGFPVSNLEDLRRYNFNEDALLSRNVLRFFKENPALKARSVDFSTASPGEQDFSYDAKDLPDDVKTSVMRFVRDASMTDRPEGTLLSNSPIGNYDLLENAYEKGLDETTSSYLRQAKPFWEKGVKAPTIRGKAYTLSGYGPVDRSNQQYLYVDREGKAIPLQLAPPEEPLVGKVDIINDIISVDPSASYKSQPRFYSTFAPGITPESINRLAGDIKRTPSSLAPGAADLIPSAEAVRKGYEEGPAAMGAQMAKDFVAGIPVSAALTPVLANPAVAPFAPGIGAGLLGVAGTEALNEVVRQETGEGIIPKFRQFLGTEERTGMADKLPELVTEDQPVPTLGKAEPRSPLQKFRDEILFRTQLAGERFNPKKGEFGASEILFGR